MYGNPFSDFLASGGFVTVGREAMLREIAQVITMPDPDDRDFHGLSGMGKTDIFRYVKGPQFLERYKEALFPPYDREPHRLFIAYVAGWIESIHPIVLLYREFSSAYQVYRDGLAEQYREPAPKIEIEDIGDSNSGTAMTHMEIMLRELNGAGVRVVMLLDEFDHDLAYGRLNSDEIGRLASWAEYSSLIIATERRLEDVNIAAKGSPLYKRLTRSQVRDFLPSEARAFLVAILESRQASLPKEDIDSLITLAGGLPYLLILAGRALWELRRSVGLGTSPDKLPDALRPYLENLLAGEFLRTFELYYNNRTEAQKQLLRELGAKGSLLLKSNTAEYAQLMSLEAYGLVDLDLEGRATPFSPLFGRYLAAEATGRGPSPVEATPDLTGLQTGLHDFFRGRPGEVLTFEELGERLWAWPADPTRKPTENDKRKIHLAVSRLRRELERAATGERIVSVRGRGYRYEPAR